MQMKQKFLFDILRHVHQPIQQTEFLTVGETFIVDKTKYTVNDNIPPSPVTQ